MDDDLQARTDRMAAVRNAIGTQRLAGLEVDDITKADLVRVAEGCISIEEIVAKIKQRIADGDFRD